MPGRSFSTDKYRYGFNGQEKDDEIKGTGNSIDFGARIYDPRIARWLSLDPLAQKYPSLSPYLYSLNNPILVVDDNGEEGVLYIQVMTNNNGEPLIDKTTMNEVRQTLIESYKQLDVDLDVQITFGNDIISKSEFYNREGAHFSDSYIVLGSASQLRVIDNNAEQHGWEKLDEDFNANGESASVDFFALINANNVQDISRTENFENIVDKISKTIAHESGHPKFKDHPENMNDFNMKTLPGKAGHVIGTIMNRGVTNGNYDEFMTNKLQNLHGKSEPSRKLDQRMNEKYGDQKGKFND